MQTKEEIFREGLTSGPAYKGDPKGSGTGGCGIGTGEVRRVGWTRPSKGPVPGPDRVSHDTGVVSGRDPTQVSFLGLSTFRHLGRSESLARRRTGLGGLTRGLARRQLPRTTGVVQVSPGCRFPGLSSEPL